MPASAQTPTSRVSSSSVSRSSSAEAVMRLAPASASGSSRVISDRRVSTVDAGPVGGRAGQVDRGDLQQIRVAVVQHPVLPSRQERREPPAHRAAAAREVVDHLRAGGRKVPADALDELVGPGRGVGGLAQVKPSGADADLLDGHRATPRQDARNDGCGRRPPRERLAPLARGPAQPPSQPGVAQPGPQRGGERGRIAGRDEQPRPHPVGAVTERLRHAADLGRDDRQAAGEGLGDDHAVRLRARRQHQRIRCAVAAGEIASAPRPRKAHAALQPAVAHAAAETLRKRRVALEAAHAQAVPRAPSTVASASTSTSWPLPGITAATQSSAPAVAVPGARPAASTPGSATCTRSSGRPYSSSSVRRPHPLVVMTDAAAPSTARSRARAPSVAPAPSGMCTSATSRSRPDCGTSTSGAVDADQPVEQHHRAVRKPLEDAPEAGARRGGGMRP